MIVDQHIRDSVDDGIASTAGGADELVPVETYFFLVDRTDEDRQERRADDLSVRLRFGCGHDDASTDATGVAAIGVANPRSSNA